MSGTLGAIVGGIMGYTLGPKMVGKGVASAEMLAAGGGMLGYLAVEDGLIGDLLPGVGGASAPKVATVRGVSEREHALAMQLKIERQRHLNQLALIEHALGPEDEEIELYATPRRQRTRPAPAAPQRAPRRVVDLGDEPAPPRARQRQPEAPVQREVRREVRRAPLALPDYGEREDLTIPTRERVAILNRDAEDIFG